MKIEYNRSYENTRLCHSLRWCIDGVIEEAPPNAVFIESGCYRGDSTKIVVNKLIDRGIPFKYYCIDNWEFANVTEKFSDNFQFFLDNIGDCADHVEIIRGDSLEAVENFEDDSVYFCFLDDSHVYAHVVKQIGLWLPKIVNNGILAGDDYYAKDVSDAVAQHFRGKDITKLGNSGFLTRITR